jgi:hypothetical protein
MGQCVLWGERRHGGTPLLDENELKRPSKHPDFGHFSLVFASVWARHVLPGTAALK